MNKTLKRFLSFSLIAMGLMIGSISSISAAQSGILNALVPSSGSWSSFSEGTARKDDQGNGGVYKNTSPFVFAIYGQIYKSTAANPITEKALTNDVNMYFEAWKWSDYNPSQKQVGAYYKGAVSSSNYEPSSGKVTYQIWP